MRESILAEQIHAFVREQHWQAAVLPFGATEPHNLHMPYGTDTFQVEELARRACERAYLAGARVAMLPAIPFGVNTNHLRIPGALACSVTPTTLLHVLTDLVESMERQGVRTMKPFSNFEFLRQAFTEGEKWPVAPEKIKKLQESGLITPEQGEKFAREGAIGSHLENLQRRGGFKGFNQHAVSVIISETDPRKNLQAA